MCSIHRLLASKSAAQADSAAPRHGLHGHASSGAGTDAAGDGADGISPGSGSGVGHGTSDPTNDSDDQNPQHPQHPHARRLAQVEEETDSVSGAGVKVAGMDGSSDGRDMSRSTAARHRVACVVFFFHGFDWLRVLKNDISLNKGPPRAILFESLRGIQGRCPRRPALVTLVSAVLDLLDLVPMAMAHLVQALPLLLVE